MYPPNGKPHFFADDVRPFRLSAKDRATACDGATVVSRPQPDGRYLVCAIHVATGYPIGVGVLCPHGEVSLAAIEVGRSLDKFHGAGGAMSSAARHRPGIKPHRRYRPGYAP